MNSQKGLIRFIVLIIIALALLKYFLDWSIFDLINSDKGRATVEYIKNILVVVWSYILIPTNFILNKISP